MESIKKFGDRLFGDGYSVLDGSTNSIAYKKNRRRAIFTRKCIRMPGILAILLAITYLMFLLSTRESVREKTLVSSKHCDMPTPGRPLVQYVLMLDAGSTGSRIHVYKFNYCKTQPELEDEVFEETKPGLSSFDGDAEGAAASLDKLMDTALKNVPKHLYNCTPVSVKATAGLRLLGEAKSKAILQAIEARLSSKYPFVIAKEETPVSVMDGRDEGVFAWITVNYLLGLLGGAQVRTAGTLDLGGGSAQIVFEPLFGEKDSNTQEKHTGMHQGDHKHSFGYGEKSYDIYQNSYLGYGLMESRKKMLAHIADSTDISEGMKVSHPCFPKKFEKKVDSKKHRNEINIIGGANTTNGFETCLNVARSILNVQKECTIKPCAFDGVYQPNFEQTFAQNPFYVFSYFYDLLTPLGVSDQFKLSDIKNVAERVCRHDLDLFSDSKHKSAVESSDFYCLDLTYIYTLLKHGIGVSDQRDLKTTRKINGIETGWCLGASLALLNSHAYCKA
ncbi:putative guanosine-diphosphatase [Zancudomyces culisetae]|uniref:guanosine-diphosphatase n=1 Tax=Zancudomyces culisetae TaxID=1213189 RepID=A0A1R1PWR9_ZANCU|nr:putative guanosine-diphosphatase [Zancudomyces culisetae]|eukprot:OMH85352.1 putative guanosine-diphosphatase [Zancudomyces culisetae]